MHHALHELLPPKSDMQHNLRKRCLDLTLPEKKGHPAAKNFIIVTDVLCILLQS